MIDLPNWLSQLAELSTPVLILIKWSVLLAIAWCAHALLRQSNPRWRVLLWRVTALCVILVPLVQSLAPAMFRVTSTGNDAITATFANSASNHNSATPTYPDSGVTGVVVASESMAHELITAPPVARRSTSFTPWVLIGLICLGYFVSVSRLVVGWSRIRRLVRLSEPAPERVVGEFSQVAQKLGVRRRVQIRISNQCAAPTLCGILKPTLLLPDRMTQPSGVDQFPAVFAHELSHVRSYDMHWNMVLHTISSLLWFHPLLWFARRSHVAACESVSDTVAANYVGDVGAYTRTLAQVALDAFAAPALSLGMARTSDVQDRITSLQRCNHEKNLGWQLVLMVVLSSLLSTWILGGLKAAMAQETTAQAGETEQQRGQKKAIGKQAKLNDLITPAADKSIAKALAFLASQQREDGSIGAADGRDERIAITALGGIAFLDSGSTPGKGKYGTELQKCVDYVLAHVQPSGQITSKGGLMYVHAYGLRFLADVHAASPTPATKEAVTKAVQLSVKSQNASDGWRYITTSQDADVSATACQLVALLAARRAGINVPQKTVDRALKYIKSCQTMDGGFSYTAGPNQKSGLARSAAAMASVYLSQVDDKELVSNGAKYLNKNATNEVLGNPHYFYGQYYLSIAMRHASNKHFRKWYTSSRDHLLSKQEDDGSWPKTMIDAEYSTANAVIALLSPRAMLR